jgi:hypothetical protein
MPQKTVAAKLGVKPGHRVLIVGAPRGYTLGALPPASKTETKPAGEVDLVQIFVSSMADLKQKLPTLQANLKPNALIWVTYPKGTSKVKTGLNRDTIRQYVPTAGFQVVSLIAVDETWSALRLKPLAQSKAKVPR